MKKLLFLGIVVLMVESLGAVTLPSTSYSPYAGSAPSTDESFTTNGGTMVTGSYSVLGAGTYDLCNEKAEALCASCCQQNYTEACIDACLLEHPGEFDYCEETACGPTQKSCVNECMHGPSVPLDGGLSILLLLSLAGGAAKLLRNRDKE